jgi:hypothetical protein
MPRDAPPEETDFLCENCGYRLNGLPETVNCPECGRPVAESVDDRRSLSGFEERSGLSSFLTTTLVILLRPRRFFRHILTRTGHPAAEWFAHWHRVTAALLFGLAAAGHVWWMMENRMIRNRTLSSASLVLPLWFAAGIFLLLVGVTRLAGWLSSIEGRFWGMRLPPPAVARALRFHSACYLPVGLLAVAIVWGYRFLIKSGVLDVRSILWYPWTLSAAVVVSAAYLFWQYVIAMRAIRFANR